MIRANVVGQVCLSSSQYSGYAGHAGRAVFVANAFLNEEKQKEKLLLVKLIPTAKA